MRDFKNMKRQRGRNRSGGGPSVGGGGGKTQHNANRAFDSNGPENVKIRGHAQHVFEKYQQLARDAFSSGDRVVAENYLQHADHYFRVLRTLQPQRSPSEILGRDSLASGLDIDFEEEFEQAEDVAEGAQEPGAEGAGAGEQPRVDARFDRNEGRRDAYDSRDQRADREPRRDGGDNGYRDRSDNRDRPSHAQPQRERYESRDRNEARESQPRENQSRENQGRDYQGRDYQARDGQNRDGQGRDGQGRDGQYRDSQGRDGQTREGQGRDGQYRDVQQRDGQQRDGQQRDGLGQAREGQSRDGQDRVEGRRDGRRFEPRREDRNANREPREGRYGEVPDAPAGVEADAAGVLPVLTPQAAAQPFPAASPEAEGSPVLRSEDGAMSDPPAFLQAAGLEDGETRKPRARRRRAPRSFEPPEGGEASPVEPEDA